MSKLLLLPIISVFASCSSLIKNAVNKRFPPATNTQITKEAIELSLKQIEVLDTASIGISITEKFLDSSAKKYINNIVDKIKQEKKEELSILEHDRTGFSLNEQEVILKTSITGGFKRNSKLKKLKLIKFTISARSRPTITGDKLFFYPSYTNFRIEKLKGRGLLPFLIARPLKILINSFAEQFKDNINGQIKDFHFSFENELLDTIAISKMLKSNETFKVIQDDTISLLVGLPNTTVMIEKGAINILSKVNFHNAENPSRNIIVPNLSKKQLFELLRQKFNQTWEKWLGDRVPDRTATMINSDFIDTALNKLFNNLRFGVELNKTSKEFFEPKVIKFIQRVNCENIRSVVNCIDYATRKCPHVTITYRDPFDKFKKKKKRVAEPQCFTYLTQGCLLQVAGKIAYCKTDLKNILDRIIEIGEISGSVQLNATPQIFVNRIDISTKNFLLNATLKSNNSKVGVNLKYNPRGLGALLVCPLPTRNNFDFDVRLDQTLGLFANFEKKIEGDSLIFKVLINDFEAKLGFSPSVLEALITHPQLSINCHTPINLLGAITLLATGYSVLFCQNDDSNLCAFARAESDFMFGKLYTHKFKSFDFKHKIKPTEIKTPYFTAHGIPSANSKAIGFYLKNL